MLAWNHTGVDKHDLVGCRQARDAMASPVMVA